MTETPREALDGCNLSRSIDVWFHPFEDMLDCSREIPLLDGMPVAVRPAVRGRAAP